MPLIGGSSIGCAKSAGILPAFHLSYTPYQKNEAHLERYWPNVPKYYIDKNQVPKDMTGKIFDKSEFFMFNHVYTRVHNVWHLWVCMV